MILGLEQLFAYESRLEGLDLHARLERLKQCARAIWVGPRFEWFTDHGFSHSERLVDVLGQILAHLQDTDSRLNVHELYILLAACYLHDIGMQDFKLDSRDRESFTIADYELIRRTHPARSKELILHRSIEHGRGNFEIGLDEDVAYLIPIALVSQGHGTAYFAQTIHELRNLPYSPGGKLIRGGLLAALLLIADELDLRAERARFPKEMKLSPISELHHHVHHYVADIRINPGAVATERSVSLSLSYPQNSESYAEGVTTWLVSKLQRQFRRTAEVVETATQGELRWARYVEVKVGYDNYGVLRQLPPSAQLELRRQLIMLETVDYQETQEVLEEVLATPRRHRVACLLAEDEQAHVQMLNWLEVQCQYHQIKLFRMDLRYEPYSVADILEHLRRWLIPERVNLAAFPECPSEVESSNEIVGSKKAYLDRFVEDVKRLTIRDPLLLLFQNLDAAEPEVVGWIGRSLLYRLRRAHLAIPIVITCQHLPKQLTGSTRDWDVLPLGNLAVDDISLCLEMLGFGAEQAHEKALEIHGTSGGGQPQGVLFAIRRLRLMEARIVK